VEAQDCGTKAHYLSLVTCPWSAAFAKLLRARVVSSLVVSRLVVRCSLRELLNHFLKLLTDYRSSKAIDSDACHADLSRRSLREGGSLDGGG
jgi:hypothetical protein